MQKAILRKVIRHCMIGGQPAQEIPDLRLVTPYQLAERVRVVGRQDASDEVMIFGVAGCNLIANQSRSA